MYDSLALKDLFRARALRFGDFTLASGKKSTYYVDKMQVTLHSHGLRMISEGFWEALRDVQFDAVGGMTIGADPLVGGVLTIASQAGCDLKGFLVRKEAKGHGTQKFIEGPLAAGDRVVIVEDVVTTGGSSLLAIDRVQEFGAEVVQVLAIVDRMEGGAANFEARGIPFLSLMTIADFGITPPTGG
ncbi:MAG: orotate phosphoribosyltransferase [Planctomycetaceae bacterium]|nr:orotate phosphoribosyltransferase [Planctomycetaceae bacterium]